jgi:hypothetical protein
MRDSDFRGRGKDISRVEGSSDAVFGFAITLLVISLEVQKSADGVLHAMRGLFPFAVTFAACRTNCRSRRVGIVGSRHRVGTVVRARASASTRSTAQVIANLGTGVAA